MTSLNSLPSGISLALVCTTAVAAQSRPDATTIARAVDSLAARAVLADPSITLTVRK